MGLLWLVEETRDEDESILAHILRSLEGMGTEVCDICVVNWAFVGEGGGMEEEGCSRTIKFRRLSEGSECNSSYIQQPCVI